MLLFLDIETYSDVPITNGTHAYAEQAEVLLVSLAQDDEPARVTDCTVAGAMQEVKDLVAAADRIVIHNSAFDRTVLRHVGVDVPLERTHDTMAHALAHGLPASLGALCDVLGVPQDKAKDKAGAKLVSLFTKPRPKRSKISRATPLTHWIEWPGFVEYARRDVEAMREVYKRLPRWNDTPAERAVWLCDQGVNERGICVDLDLARGALRAAKRAGADISERADAMTEGAVPSLTQRDRLLRYLSDEHDYAPIDMTRGTVASELKKELDPEVRELLELRRQASATSPAKYQVLLKAASSDGRLRGTLQYCGASRTGRWGGRLFQPQNLPRPTLSRAQIDTGIAAMKADCEDLITSNVMELCTSAVRGCLVAAEGKKLVISDLSNIEGRVLAWLAGEAWKVEAFSAFDRGKQHDIYILAYSRAFNTTPEAVIENKKSGDGMMRQLGKIMELALGYQGSVGAFASMARLYGIEKDEDDVKVIVNAWRKAHKATVSFWYGCETAAKNAIREPGETFVVRDLQFDVRDAWLRVKLPSGRYLCYPEARVEDGKITYAGTNQYTRKWQRLDTYGGKLVENIVQATARDVLASGMIRACAADYSVCLHVHDELITETPKSEDYTAGGLSKIMATNPGWAIGLPLAAAGYETDRYRKD